jgi:putative FmdB family regulatory protein
LPIYEFVCQSCGNEFEQIQSFSDSTVPSCTKCGSTQVVRRMGKPAIHFKGSGWYVNDSKKSSENNNGAGKNGTESSKSESVSEGASESKTEAAAEGKDESKSEAKSETKSDTKSETKSSNDSKSESTTKSAAPVASE